MTTIDYQALRGEVGGDPAEGTYLAYLARASLVETKNGSTMLVTEWQTMDPPHYWTAWFGFDGKRLPHTQELLDGLGIDRQTVTDDDAFEVALQGAEGRKYTVQITAWSGGVNTVVQSAAVPAYESDAPVDTEGLPPAQEPAAALQFGGDNDIPF
jgi:hypothetical protein